jgi:hypothetical protein
LGVSEGVHWGVVLNFYQKIDPNKSTNSYLRKDLLNSSKEALQMKNKGISQHKCGAFKRQFSPRKNI